MESAILAVYLMGDASREGFGSAIFANGRLDYQSGSWAKDFEDESSNWREAKNLTSRVERMGNNNSLTGNEIFLVTDNKVYEGTYYKGHLDSPKLNDLVFRLHWVERRTGAIIHLIHMTGSWMKDSRIDGLLRDDLMVRIMAGVHPLKFLPFDLGADKQS